MASTTFAADQEQQPVNSITKKLSDVAPCWGVFEIRNSKNKLIAYESYVSNTTNQNDCMEELYGAQTLIGAKYWYHVVKLVSHS